VRLLDVGSGAGLPGVVIAICCPEVDVSCVDTVAKKAAFIQQVAASLKLAQPAWRACPGGNLTGPFDVVSSRAFASLATSPTGREARWGRGVSGWP
jgi:16S rRNA (guanine527-N7)-methyltransferase